MPDRERAWTGDLALTGLVLLLAAFFPLLVGFHYRATPMASQFAVSLLMITPLALRSHHPQLMLALTTVGGIGHLFVANGPLPCLVVVPLVVYSVAREVDARSSRSALAVGLAAAVLGPLQWFWLNRWELNFLVVVILVCAGTVLTPYVIGRRLQESEKAKEAAERAEAEHIQTLLAEREQRARMAEISARQQIARELHDIVAHSLSVMVVQAEGGRAMAAKKPERAAEVLETIAGTGREALAEMRRIVGVLRSLPEEGVYASERGEPAYAPMPGIADIADMVQRTGDRVRLEQVGDVPPGGAATQLTVYRVVQEALTNFLRHAGPDAKAVVRLEFADDHLDIEITDNGVGETSQSDGLGHGLKGMHERVAAMGGVLTSGPLPGRGFQVAATLPLGHRRSHVKPEGECRDQRLPG